MCIEVTDFCLEKTEEIKAACNREWAFEDWVDPRPGNVYLRSTADGSLCGGESEEEFSDRIAITIWKANGKYCEVMVSAIYMEELPFENHVRDENDYDRLA
jgi:hypothetical protein